MKRLIFILLVFLLSLSAFSQQRKTVDLSDTVKFGKAKCTYKSELKGLSPNTAFLVYDLVKLERELTKADTALIKKYSLKEIDGRLFVGAFLQFSSDFDLSKLSAYEIKINTKFSTLATVLIPIDRFIEFCQSSLVNYIDIGSKAKPLMNNAKGMTNSNQVHQGINLPQGYYGKDVVVGIIDTGFDYTHPNFWDSTMTNYRVKRVWEQEYNYGTPPQNFEYGTELTTQEEILGALYSHTNKSHGTHVAGIAAGGGTTVESLSQYKGVAPESDIVLVSINTSIRDALPSDIFNGIGYIVEYAQSVGKPCVINMSLGQHIGPHDGTSQFDLACDVATQVFSEGVLLVGAAGNEGDSQIHLAKNFSSDSDLLNTFLIFKDPSTGVFTSAGSGIIDIWGSSDFTIQITPYDIEDNEVAGDSFTINTSQAGGDYFIGDNDFWSTDYCHINSGTEEYQNKKHIQIAIDNTAQDDIEKVLYISVSANNGVVHMWNISETQVFSSQGYYNCYDGNDFYTCGEIGGTGNSMISVGAYTSRSSWTSIYGDDYDLNYDVNDIAPFSSKGPTTDGRIKPDITAPGAWIVSSVNSYDPANYSLTSPMSIDGIIMGQNQEPVLSENTWLWGVMQGTSMAAPIVTGVLALWLEAYPELTISQAKQLLRESAIVDSYTGTIDSTISVNNITWGAGKVNAYAGLQLLLQKIPNRYLFSQDTVYICGEQPITLSAPEGYSKYIWSNGDTTRTIQVSSSDLGIYSVRFINSEGYKSPWSDSIIVAVTTPPIILGDTEICEGNSTTIIVENASSIEWSNGHTLNNLTVSPNSTRSYYFTMIDNYGCSYSDSVQIIVHQTTNITLSANICEGETYNENGFNVDEAGSYVRSLQSVNGCDSIITLTVTEYPTFDTTINATINSGETYAEFGFNESESGTYVQNLQTVNGCDSTITLNLTVNSSLYDVAELAEITFYPNPTSGILTFSKEIEKIEVIDNIGKVVMRFFETEQINIESLPSGVYHLRLTIEDKTTTRKVIKE